MTILAAETTFYPVDLWDERPSSGSDPLEERWWCLHTMPRQEKAVARELREAGVGFYLPQTIKNHRTPKGRRLRSLIPVFTGYVFLHGDYRDRSKALQSNRLVGILEVHDQEGLEQDLRRVHKLLSLGLPLRIEEKVVPGTTVRVKTGPLTGLEGTVVRRSNGDHFVVTVRFLSRGASVFLRDGDVQTLAGV